MIKKKEKTSGEIICEFFKLEPQTIYQDYSCSYHSGIMFFGRLYIGESHFCFNSYMFGVSKKVVIKIDTIVKMQLNKNMITGTYGTDRAFCFSGFVNVANVYKLMFALWRGEQIEAKILNTNQQQDSKQQEISLDKSNFEISFFKPEQSADSKQTLAQIVFPCTVQQYYDYFLSDKSTLFGARQHLQRKQAENIQITEWKKNEELQREVRQIRASIKVEKVPLRSRASLCTIQTMKREQNGDMLIQRVTQVGEVPYASYFTTQQIVTVKSLDQKRCKFSVEAWVPFNKSSVLKRTIQDRTLNDLKQDYQIWLGAIQSTLESLKMRRSSVKKQDLNRSMQYQKAQSTLLDFNTEMMQSFSSRHVQSNIDQKLLLRLNRKMNAVIALLVVLILAMGISIWMNARLMGEFIL